MPGSVHISIQILLWRLSWACPITRVVIGEHVAVDAGAQADVEATHLTQVYSITMGKQQGVASVGRTSHKHTGDSVPPRCPGHETLNGVLLPGRVLPIRTLRKVEGPAAAALVTHEGVSGLRRKEGQLGGYSARAWWTAEKATQLTQWQVIHPSLEKNNTADWKMSGVETQKIEMFVLKWSFTQMKILNPMSFQTCMAFFWGTQNKIFWTISSKSFFIFIKFK